MSIYRMVEIACGSFVLTVLGDNFGYKDWRTWIIFIIVMSMPLLEYLDIYHK